MHTSMVKALMHQHRTIKCSLNDHFVFRTPVSVVFFYPQKIPKEIFINSLQNVLNDFPIFAGRLSKVSGQLYIDCNNQGVQINEVHNPISLFKKLSGSQNPDPLAYIDLINPDKVLKQLGPVLTIKLTYCEDGMAVGYCWHHSIGDMSTFMQFLKGLSSFAKGIKYQLPILAEDRGIYLKQWMNKKEQARKENDSCRLKCLNMMDIFRFAVQVYSSKKIVYLYFPEHEMAALRDSFSNLVGRKLTRNDVLCAHLLNIIAKCRNDNALSYKASVVVNFRRRIGMPTNALGNYVDAIALQYPKNQAVEALANTINLSIQGYDHFNDDATQEFVRENGGIEKVGRIIPEDFLPQNKNCIFTNWSNFEVYSIDFGVAAPYLFLPVGQALLPWVSCIVEGFENKGLMTGLILPSKIAERLIQPDMLKFVHQHRDPKLAKDQMIKISWCY